MGTFLPSTRNKIYQEDVQGGASVSESVGATLGSTMNFILDYIVQKLSFGAGGAVTFSGLTMPYTFSGNSEIAFENYLINKVTVSLQYAGSSGQTEFKIERRPIGSSTWTNIFSTNCVIVYTAAANILFSSDAAAPASVTLPILASTILTKGDEIRFVLITAANQAVNLLVNLEVSPT